MHAGVKKIWENLRAPSVLRYIMAFSSIVLLIFVAMGGYLYRYYYNTLYADFLQSNETYLSSIETRHENDLQMIKNIRSQISLSDKVTKFYLGKQPEKAVELEKQLYQYSAVSQFFSQVLYFYHPDPYLYNHRTSISLDMFLSRGLLLGNTRPEAFSQQLLREESGISVLPEQEASGYLTERYNGYVTRAAVYLMCVPPENKSTLIFLVDSNYFDALLGCETENSRENLLLFGGEVIAARGSLTTPTRQLAEAALGMKTAQDTVRLDGKKYLFTIRTNEEGLRYCTVQSFDVFSDKVFTNQWGILALLLVCSIPAALLLTVLSRELSGRVRRLNRLLEDTDEPATECYNLVRIENRVELLVQENKEGLIERQTVKKSTFIRSFVRNDYENAAVMEKAAAEVGFSVAGRQYLVALLRMAEGGSGGATGWLLPALEKIEPVQGYGIHLVNHSQMLLVLFGDTGEELTHAAQSLFDAAGEHREGFVMAVSDIHTDFGEASRAYLEADTAFDSRFLRDNRKILCFREVVTSEKVEALPSIHIQQLKNAIHTGNTVEADKIIEDFCGKMRAENQSLLSFRLVYDDMIRMLLSESSNHAIYQDIYSVFALSQCLSVQDFNDLLREVCHRLMEGTAAPQGEGQTLVHDATAYMVAHYAEPDLNMASLAEHLAVSPAALSVKFKESMQISPSDYLSNVRMEKAKTLLRETEMRVKDIGLAVGYEDDHVFMRRFKKQVGKTPGQYRQEHRIRGD